MERTEIKARCENCGVEWTITPTSTEEEFAGPHTCPDDSPVVLWFPEKEN